MIGASGTTLLTRRMEAELPVINGAVGADVANDILHIACVERYGKNGGIGKAFIHGVGLREGAIAISVGHDHHNITVCGANFEDNGRGGQPRPGLERRRGVRPGRQSGAGDSAAGVVRAIVQPSRARKWRRSWKR